METAKKLIPVQQVHVFFNDPACKIHSHYEWERRFSILLLVTGVLACLSGSFGVIFLSAGAYTKGVASIFIIAGMVLSCKGFLVNLRNQKRYNELVREVLVKQQLPARIGTQEQGRVRQILFFLATEEMVLSLIFVLALVFLHLVKGYVFWSGICDALLAFAACLIIENTYRIFKYNTYAGIMDAGRPGH